MSKRVLFESLLAISAVLLIFVAYLMVSGFAFSTSVTKSTVEWNATSNDTVYYITSCSDGTLRALMDGHILAIDQQGSPMWRVDIPDKWWVGSEYYPPAVATGADSTLYVYLRANVTRAAMEDDLPYTYSGDYATDNDEQNQRLMDAYAGTAFAMSLNESVLAIAANGAILWDLPLQTGLYGADIRVENGTIYVYHDYNETAIDRSGNILWNISGVGAAPAVNDAGYVYTVEPVGGDSPDENSRMLSGTVDAYYPNGSLFWQNDIGESTYIQHIAGSNGTMPLYDHNTLYLPLSNGIVAMAVDGSVKWVKHYNVSTSLFAPAPFDSEGNLYLTYYNDTPGVLSTYKSLGETFYAYPQDGDFYPSAGSGLSVLSPEGNEIAYTNDTTVYSAAADGIGYSVDILAPQDIMALGAPPDTAVLTARDLKEDKTLWSYNFSPVSTGSTIVNETNVRGLFSQNDLTNALTINAMAQQGVANITPTSISANAFVQVLPGESVTYASFWTYDFDSPAVYNLSHVLYSGELSAFDNTGKLLWSRPIDSLISSMYEQNGTIYYSTSSGSMSATRIDAVTGLALAALIYVLIRFGVMGSISRARSAINKNENRNAVFKYIIDYPGSTMYEISRNLHINKGTVRYHLFILKVNHRIASQKADKKFVRFFPNSNTYSKDEQLIMSLMRRDAMKKALKALIARPGMSNVQLSNELNLPESAMSKHMKELCAKGIVIKKKASGNVSYAIKDEVRGTIVKALEHMG
jgi:predicted transcriptional regulator